MIYFIFFQAEAGIRAGHVPGVQTCALPISREGWTPSRWISIGDDHPEIQRDGAHPSLAAQHGIGEEIGHDRLVTAPEIGRASCRERVRSLGAARSIDE